ncbi:hypothetical protein AUF78_04880 [archaeon 13_1_20CM_2_51_12]|nr:MAG: hypothetical protein AUF78_04880 [archaeon 13_1_20CM_2_51_12]
MTIKTEEGQSDAVSHEKWPFDGSESGVSVILSEVSRNDSILQSYRDQFMVAETFTAAIAASALFTTPNIAFFVAVLGIPLLIGWVQVVRSQAKAFDYWSDKLARLDYFQEYFELIGRKKGYSWARVWLGGGPGKLAIGILQWVFAIFWLAVLVNAVLR